MARIERTKNATRNIFFGVILNLYNLAVPFAMRTAMIYLMGEQYLGLNGLFTSVLQVLNLAELGVGAAMVFSMYKPIAEDDEDTICALMKLYRTYYHVIGLIIAAVGCALTPFIPRLIKGSYPAGINIYLLYLLNLGATVLSYWLFAYKNSILAAHQRTDISSRISMITGTIQYAAQILVLWLTRNYYLYVIVALLTQVLTNVTTAVCADRMYPQFKPKGQLDQAEVKRINQKIRDLFTAKFGGVIVNSADTIVISAFLGLSTLAVYQNYYFIMNSVCGFITVCFSAIVAGMGNSMVTESMEKNYNDFKKLTFIVCFILCICCCCFAGLYQPFMKLWVGERLMLDYSFVVLFCVLFYCLELAMVWATAKDAAGLWHNDRFRPLIGALVNLLLNLLLTRYIGLYGIILSTIISYVFISMPWLIRNLFLLLYKQSLVPYLLDVALYIIVTVVSVIATILICSFINVEGIAGLIAKGMICVIIPLAVECIVFFRKREFRESVTLIKNMLKKG